MYLNCHSQYSLRYGTVPVNDVVAFALENNIGALAFTDINNTATSLEFVKEAQKTGLKPVLGVDFRNGVQQQFVALARNNEGWCEINTYLTDCLGSGNVPAEAPVFEQVFVIYPMQNAPARRLRENEYIGISAPQITKLKFSRWKNQLHKAVALQPMTFRNKRDFNAHRLLRAIDLNTLLSKLPVSEQGLFTDLYLSPAELERAFSGLPEIIANANRLLSECHIEFEFGNYERSLNKKHYKSSFREDFNFLKEECEKGLARRYKSPTGKVRERLENELGVISDKKFVSYFLINWDIVQYAQRKGYFYVGRGSGANSMVAYLLRITDVDPIDLDLYFERFINHSRKNPPDFDLDFSWKDREDVTRHIFRTFENATLLGSHTTFKDRAVMRELGKVLGLPPDEIDKLAGQRIDPKQLDDISRLVVKYGSYIHGFPNIMSVHAGGILIPEKHIHHYGATFVPPKGFPTTQFDMYIAEDTGLHKFDILGQRGLGKIKDALEVVRENHPGEPPIDIHNIERFKQDEKIKGLLREGKTMACFYVESPAMRGLLKKLQADTYLGLVAASSIIRPGVAQSGMMQEYIKRFRNPEARKYIHPKMQELMADTYGVMVYQEDVLKVASFFAGLTLEEADILRRGMSWKFREKNEFWKIKDKFISNCLERGYGEMVTAEVWRQIESFGNYAFSKGHSASYAVESYQSLFLKAYFPIEYLVATINNGGGFYRTEIYVHEARMHGAIIEAPCVNRGRVLTTVRGKHVFLGFQHIKDLEAEVMHAVERERQLKGEFYSLQDFLDRVNISLEQLVILIRIDAFRTTGKGKKELLWEAHFLLGATKKSMPEQELFRKPSVKLELSQLESVDHEDAFDQMEILGFPLHPPFNLVQGMPQNTVMSQEFHLHIGKEVTTCGYLVHVKYIRTRTKDAKHMQFGCFLDEEGHFIDTVHFPQSAAKYPFSGPGVYLLKGKVVSDYDFLTLEVSYMERLPVFNPADDAIPRKKFKPKARTSGRWG